jgi:hypothetical protein
MKRHFKMKISNWTGFVKEATWFFRDFTTNLHSANVSAVIFKDKSNITLISMFVCELPKSQTWRYDEKEKGSSRNITTSYCVCLQQPHPEC